tara:strand:+ start:345 stop:527 length:183 start_codon:yes stop_codon:yes gene_type:complete
MFYYAKVNIVSPLWNLDTSAAPNVLVDTIDIFFTSVLGPGAENGAVPDVTSLAKLNIILQ